MGWINFGNVGIQKNPHMHAIPRHVVVILPASHGLKIAKRSADLLGRLTKCRFMRLFACRDDTADTELPLTRIKHNCSAPLLQKHAPIRSIQRDMNASVPFANQISTGMSHNSASWITVFVQDVDVFWMCHCFWF